MDKIGQLMDPDPLALQRALAERDKQMQKMYGAQGMAQGNYGAAGGLGVLGNLIGGLLARRHEKRADAANQEFIAQNQTYNRDLAQFKAQQEAQQAEALRAQKLADEKAKYEREQAGRMQMAQFKVDNRQAPQQAQVGFNERLYNSMSPDNQQAYRNKMAGVQQAGDTVFNPTEQALIQSGQVTEDQLMQKKANDALGVKPQTAGEKKEIKNTEKMLQAVNRLDDMVAENGTEYWGTDAKLMKTTHTDLMLSLKEAANLGVLSGSDLELVNSLVNDPTAISTQMNPNGAKNIRAQLGYLKDKYGGIKPEQQKTTSGQGMDQTSALLNKYLSK